MASRPIPVDQRKRARLAALEFMWLQSGDKRLAVKCIQLIHGPICMYASSREQLKVARHDGVVRIDRMPATDEVTSPLAKLLRHCEKGGYLWKKAWVELTPAARTMILSSLPRGTELPIGRAPDKDLIAPFIAAAIAKGRRPRITTSERDTAVIAILRAYRTLYGTKPPSPKGSSAKTPQFIAEIERAYREILPEGFGVNRSKATMDRLIKRAAEFGGP